MSMIKCPSCGEEIPSDFGISWGDACPFCMATLTEPTAPANSFGTTLGDANAISGGIHNTDSHNVDSHDVHNTTHNVTNYVQQAAKSAEETAREHKFEFRQYCEKIIQKGGLVSAEGKILLERKMFELGLSQEEGDSVITSVKSSKMRSSSELNILAKIKLDSAKSAIKQNAQNLGRSLSELKAQCLIYDNEELHFYYNMLLAALDAKQCISRYEGRKADSYWMAFWVYLAYIKVGDRETAEQILAWLSTFEGMPQENLILLDAAGRINEIIGNEDAKESQLLLLEEASADCSDLLGDFRESLIAIYSNKMEKPDFFAKYFSLGSESLATIREDSKSSTAEKNNKPEAERQDASKPAGPVAEKQSKNTDHKPDNKETKSFPYDIVSLRNEFGDLRELADDEIDQVFAFLTEKSNSGNPEAKYLLAQMYMDGLGAAADPRKGVDLLRQASAKGFTMAGVALGACYLYGNGVKKDLKEAEQRLKPGMTSNNPSLWRVLGDLFFEKGAPALAEVWYKKAEAKGISRGRLNPEVSIDNLYLDTQTEENGEIGMVIGCDFTLKNLKDSDCLYSALFFWEKGPKVLSRNPNYSTSDGQLSTFAEVGPVPFEDATMKDFQLFIPFTELPTKRDGTFKMMLKLVFSRPGESGQQILFESSNVPFDIIVSGQRITINLTDKR